MSVFRAGFLLFLLCFFSEASCVLSQAAPAADGAEVIEITSRRLESDHAAGTARFIGEVIAVQGDTTIRAEELILFQSRQGQGVERVEAYRAVRIEQGERVATGQKAVFEQAGDRVVLTGSPKVRQGDDFVEGDEIVFFINSDRSIVRSKGSERVKAVFHPKERGAE